MYPTREGFTEFKNIYHWQVFGSAPQIKFCQRQTGFRHWQKALEDIV
jgi:hypothetical protein